MGIPTLPLLLLLAANTVGAASLRVVDADGKPLATVMVSRLPTQAVAIDTSDNGYPPSGKLQQGIFELTRFTDATGRVDLPDLDAGSQIRLRRAGYQDRLIPAATATSSQPLSMQRETDPAKLAAQQPSNAWTSLFDFGSPALKKNFLLHCNFCHQQGARLMRAQRSVDEWQQHIKRMVRYGARLSSEGQKALPALLEAHWRKVHANPAQVPAGTPWSAALAGSSIRELAIGDRYSQMHDLLYHSSGRVYVGDNLQDRLYEIDPQTGGYTVIRIPAEAGDTLGGLLAGRLLDFPKHETYQGIHSLAESPKDGRIFITPSYQRRVLEFDPQTRRFIVHQMDRGFYPHTIRIDAKDRVWFTLALSNQVAMFDRASGRFRYFELPYRGVMEWLTVKLTPFFFKLMAWGLPIANWVKVDGVSTGVPLPYGIDLTPDGHAWIARLHTDEIASIDADSGEIKMIPTPRQAPRRLRSDREGKLWIVAFNESALLRYDPATGKFEIFDLPVVPAGSETPYSLNVDRVRHQVWVNGTNSDAVYRLDIASGRWAHYPLPRQATFTRDVEIAPDGRVFLSSASFPSWHSEDAQPTLIELTPGR